jgi:hypothetical protein
MLAEHVELGVVTHSGAFTAECVKLM